MGTVLPKMGKRNAGWGGEVTAAAHPLMELPSNTVRHGLVMKKNSWGYYQKRYVYVSDGGDEKAALTYHHYPMKKGETPKRISVTSADIIDRFGEFYVEMEDDKELSFQARAAFAPPPEQQEQQQQQQMPRTDVEEAEAWVLAINKAISMKTTAANAAAAAKRKKLQSELEAAAATSTSSPDAPIRPTSSPEEVTLHPPAPLEKEGWLDMPSASRFKKWQARYFRLRAGSLYYYVSDSRKLDDYEGQISLDPKTTTGLSCDAAAKDNRIFTVRTTTRAYDLQAPSVDACLDWFASVSRAREAVAGVGKGEAAEDEEGGEDETSARLMADRASFKVPKWIQVWDSESDADHVLRIQRNLDAQFEAVGKEPDLPKTLAAVTNVIEELDDRARECLPVGGHPEELTEAGREPRPDIFEVILRFYHLRIVQELSLYMTGERYSHLEMRDLLRLMDIITAYDGKLAEILQGPVGEGLQQRIPPFALGDNAENMSDVYLRKLKVQLAVWVDNVVTANVKAGESRVQSRIDGRLQTPGPTDLFNLLNEALTLAGVSGVRKLQAQVVAQCTISLADYLFAVVSDLVATKSESFRYACATANDCWSVIDHIDRLESQQRAALTEFLVDFNPLREKCAAHANTCLEVIAAMVLKDLRPPMQIAFTKQYLESTKDLDDAVAVAIATLDDYFEDFARLLELPFVARGVKMCARDLIGLYLARLAAAFRDEGLLAVTKREIQLIQFDRQRIHTCFEGRIPQARRMCAVEFAPLEEILEMLTAPPSLVPATAVKVASREPLLRLQVQRTAKMCVDLICNAQATGTAAKQTDRLANEVKTRVVMEIDEKVPAPEVSTISFDDVVRAKASAYAKMWPDSKVQGEGIVKNVNIAAATLMHVKRVNAPVNNSRRVSGGEDGTGANVNDNNTAAAGPTAVSSSASGDLGASSNRKPSASAAALAAARERERREFAQEAAPVVQQAALDAQAKRAEILQKQNSSVWAPPTRPGVLSSTKKEIETGAASAPVSTPLPLPVEGEFVSTVLFRDYGKKDTGKEPPAVQCACALRRISDKSSDMVFIVYAPGGSAVSKQSSSSSSAASSGGMTGGNALHRVPVTDIVRVEFWDSLPMRFGVDGRVVHDLPVGRLANKNVELMIGSRAGDRLHLTCTDAKEAAKWVEVLRAAVSASFATWGSTYREPVEDLDKMRVNDLKVLAKNRGVNISECVEKSDIVKAIRAHTEAQRKALEASLAEAKRVEEEEEEKKKKQTKTEAAAATVASKTPPPPPPATTAAKATPQPSTSGANKPTTTTTMPPPVTQPPPTAAKPPAVVTPPPPAASVAAAKPSAVSAPTPASAAPVASPPPPPAATTSAPKAPVVVAAAAGGGAAAAAVGAAAATAKPPAAGKAPPNENDVIELQLQITRGYELLEEGEASQAMHIFQRAIPRATELDITSLRAKATAGLAGAYRDLDSMRRASGPMFEVAASYYGSLGDTSDRINVLNEAADVYLRTNQPEKAINCLERYDALAKKMGGQPVFEKRVREIKTSLGR